MCTALSSFRVFPYWSEKRESGRVEENDILHSRVLRKDEGSGQKDESTKKASFLLFSCLTFFFVFLSLCLELCVNEERHAPQLARSLVALISEGTLEKRRALCTCASPSQVRGGH